MARTGQQLRVRTAKAMADSGRPSVKTATEKKSGLGDRLRYMFDNSMSSGTPALVAWLIAATLLLIIVFSVILAITGMNNDGTDRGPIANLFYNLLHALDPGTVGGDSGSWAYLLTMLAAHPRRPVHRQRADRCPGHRHRLQARRPAPRPLDRARGGAHRHPGLVGVDLHDHLRADAGQREPQGRR